MEKSREITHDLIDKYSDEMLRANRRLRVEYLDYNDRREMFALMEEIAGKMMLAVVDLRGEMLG